MSPLEQQQQHQHQHQQQQPACSVCCCVACVASGGGNAGEQNRFTGTRRTHLVGMPDLPHIDNAASDYALSTTRLCCQHFRRRQHAGSVRSAFHGILISTIGPYRRLQSRPACPLLCLCHCAHTATSTSTCTSPQRRSNGRTAPTHGKKARADQTGSSSAAML